MAAFLFFLYRRSKRTGSVLGGRRNNPKPWRSAHLHGPRRFFGLLPDRSEVQHKTRKESAWEIDGNDTAQALYPDFGDGGSPTSFHTAQDSQPHISSHNSGHSRTESTASLLTNTTQESQRSSRSFFTALAGKFSALSLNKTYQSGTAKGPDYRRVHVVPGSADQRFKIDGSETPATNTHFTFPPAPEREESLPSVLDIRHPSTAGGSRRSWRARDESFPPPTRFTGDDEAARTDFMDGPVSDFSLGTSDLVTPISPASTGNEIVGVRRSLRFADRYTHLQSLHLAKAPVWRTPCVTTLTSKPFRPHATQRRAPVSASTSQCFCGHFVIPALSS